MAYRAGISVGTLSRIECAAANPSWTTVARIAAALDLSLRVLVAAMEERG